MRQFLTICLIFLSLTACSPTVKTSGNLILPSKMAEIQPDISTRADVARSWGPPTAEAPFDNKTWYYIGEQTETLGVFKHDIKERKIIAVYFNDTDIVTKIEPIDPANGKEIAFVERQTPTAGKEYTIFQQLIGNVGRFNPQGTGAPRSGP